MLLPEAIREFKLNVAPDKARVKHLPPLIFVFGGDADIKSPRDSSCRNLFLQHAHENKYPHAPFFKLPEEYPEWNEFEGYGNLVDFEIEVGSLARAIVLFSEGPGAYAELGAFCMDPILRERLFVVISKKHYEDPSFIALGPIKRIEDESPDHAICVVQEMHPPITFEPHIDDVLAALSEKLASSHKTQAFDPNRTRDQYLLIADLIDLFCALTVTEIQELIVHMGIEIDLKRIKRILRQLEIFNLVSEVQITTRRYFVASKSDNSQYLDYERVKGGDKFDRIRFKMKIFDSLAKDRLRNNAYAVIHGKK